VVAQVRGSIINNTGWGTDTKAAIEYYNACDIPASASA
jgi:hypothetical protein